MSTNINRRLATQCNNISWLLAVIVCIIGAAVIIGWIFDITVLKSIKSSYISMKPLTAIAFIFSGISLLLQYKKAFGIYRLREYSGKILSIFVILIGVITLLEYNFSQDFQINKLLTHIFSNEETTLSKPSTITAFNFIFIGSALLLLDVKFAVYIRQTLSIIIALSGILIITSYSFSVYEDAQIVYYASASIYTSCCLILMAAALLFARPSEGMMDLFTSNTEGGTVARTFIPFLIIIPVVLHLIQQIISYDQVTEESLFLILLIALLIFIGVVLSSWLMRMDLARTELEYNLQISEEKFRNAMGTAPIGMAIISLDGHFVEVNNALCQIVGYTKEELEKLTFQQITYPDDLAIDIANAQQLIDGKIQLHQVQKRYIRKDGIVIWVQLTASILKDNKTQKPMFFITQVEDITLRKQNEDQMRSLAYLDTLTSIPNRRLLLDRVNHAISSAKRHHHTLAIMFLDLDKFKLINDTLGHSIGDELLKSVSVRLTNALRKEDTVARISGDEFVILLNEITNIQDAGIVADKILENMKKTFLILGHEINIGASIGIAIYPNDGDETNQLLKNADSAMYAAKHAGRNQYKFYKS